LGERGAPTARPAAIATGLMVPTGPEIELHCASCGDAGKPLLLMLHGFPECWFAWADMMVRFADRYHVVAPDLRGFNLSSKPTTVEAYRASESVQDLVALIAALGHSSATVIAHDWGGAVAWGLAIARPELVERLIILNSPHPVPFARALAGDAAQQAASRYMNWLRAPGSEIALAENDFDRMDRLFIRFGAAGWFESMRQRYHQAWSQPGALQAMLNWYRATPLHPPTADDPGAGRLVLDPAKFRVEVPTRVIWGMDDPALLPVLLDGLEEFGDDLRIRRLPGLTHWLVHEAPDQVAAAIEESLLG
jgi:pimeloyl-ACP methyl ester carboxylesterase